MKQPLHTLLIFLMTVVNSQAQLQLKSVGKTDVSGIDLHFKFRSYQLSRADTNRSFLRQIKANSSRIEVTLPGSQPKVFTLSEVTLFADDYVETVAGADRITKTSRSSVKTFVGQEVNGTATITATIDDDFFDAAVHNGEQSWYIEQARNFTQCSNDLLVTYNAADVLTNKVFKCSAEAVEERAQELQPNQSDTQVRTMVGSCMLVRLAIAADASMFQRYGSASAVRNRILSTMNEVAAIYRQTFVNNIEFNIVAIYISQTYDQDPLLPNTTAGTGVLTGFRRWAYTNSGFNMLHNMGQLWTTRDMGAVAWGDMSSASSGICNRPNAYHVLTDDFGKDVKKRISHEMGHNFGASHDVGTDYAGYIMTGGYSPGIKWSEVSRQAINDNLVSAATACLANCPQPVTPAFELKSAGACVGNAVQFQDKSINGSSNSLWEMDGGNPSTAIGMNPIIRYDAAGLYDVKLTSSGNNLIKNDYVLVGERPKLTLQNCSLPTGSAAGGGIRMVGLNGTYIFPTAEDSIPKYVNRSCRYIIGLQAGTSYDFLVKIGSRATDTTSQVREHVKVYIDYNNDGLFNESNELIIKSPNLQSTNILINENNSKPWLNFTTPTTVVKNTFLRMRVISDNVVPVNSCHSPQTGQVKDFSVVFRTLDALAVKLVYFKVIRQENAAHLEWETASEVNSNRFEVEYSADLRDWKNAGMIRAQSTSNKPVRYQLIDTTRHAGMIYYRLRMIDEDGSFAFSSIQSIRFDRKGMIVFPNPAQDYIFISDVNGVTIPSSEIREVSITNLAGITVHTQKFPLSSKGIAVGNLTKGIYFVKLSATNGTQSTHKLIISK
jgi:PKD repeat protein